MTADAALEKAAQANYERFHRDLVGTSEPSWETLGEKSRALLIESERAAIVAYLRAEAGLPEWEPSFAKTLLALADELAPAPAETAEQENG